MRDGRLTPITPNILPNQRLHTTLLRSINTLRLHPRTTGPHTPARIHALLQRISLPPEYVIRVLAQAGMISRRQDKRLRPISRPLSLVVKLDSIPYDLVHELGDAHGVGRRTVSAQGEEGGGAGGRVGDVVLVVGRVVVLAVPAGWEGHGDTPAAATGSSREARDVLARAGSAAEWALLHVGLAAEADPTRHLLGIAVGWVTNEHAEALDGSPTLASSVSITFARTYWLEGRDLGARCVSSNVVNCHAALDIKPDVRNLGNPLKGAVLGLEVSARRPVVAEVLRVGAAGASGLGRGVEDTGRHAGVERVASDDLMDVGAPNNTRIDQGVDPVDGKLGAAEPHQLLGSGELHHRQGGSERLVQHLSGWIQVVCCGWWVEKQNKVNDGFHEREESGKYLAPEKNKGGWNSLVPQPIFIPFR